VGSKELCSDRKVLFFDTSIALYGENSVANLYPKGVKKATEFSP
jgi:hypothetical protein